MSKRKVDNQSCEELDSLETRMENMEKKQGEFITWPWFITTLVAIGGIQVTMWVYLINEVKQVKEAGYDTKNAVFEINGKLEPFEFIND